MRKLALLVLLVACGDPTGPREQTVPFGPAPPLSLLPGAPCMAATTPFPFGTAFILADSAAYMRVRITCHHSSNAVSYRYRVITQSGDDVLPWTDWSPVPAPDIRVDRSPAVRILVWDLRDDSTGVASTGLIIVQPHPSSAPAR